MSGNAEIELAVSRMSRNQNLSCHKSDMSFDEFILSMCVCVGGPVYFLCVCIFRNMFLQGFGGKSH